MISFHKIPLLFIFTWCILEISRLRASRFHPRVATVLVVVRDQPHLLEWAVRRLRWGFWGPSLECASISIVLERPTRESLVMARLLARDGLGAVASEDEVPDQVLVL